MKNPGELFYQFPTLEFNSFLLRQLKLSDFHDLKLLFNDENTKKYYHILPEQNENLDLLFAKFLEYYKSNIQLTWVITPLLNTQKTIGFVTVEFKIERQLLFCVLTYVVNPNYRNKGIASQAVAAVCNLLIDYELAQIRAEIDTENIGSEKVIKRNGFTKVQGLALFDNNFPDSVRCIWTREIIGVRAYLFMKAMSYCQRKEYSSGIEIFKDALKQQYVNETPYTDTLIYANLGIALSSFKQYKEAYFYLIKVVNMGYNEPLIIKEINWLKTNVPHLL